MRNLLHLFIVVMVSVVITGFFSFGSQYEKITADGSVYKIPVEKVNDGKAHFFQTVVDGKTVKFFLVKSSDGLIRAAFDACDVCYAEKKGYVQEGSYMKCVNCGQKFHTMRINEVRGGCNPSPLVRNSDGENVIIRLSAMREGRRYF